MDGLLAWVRVGREGEMETKRLNNGRRDMGGEMGDGGR